MIPALVIMNRTADRVFATHRTAQIAFTGILSSALDNPNILSPQALSALRDSVTQHRANTMKALDSEDDDFLDRAVVQVVNAAQKDAESAPVHLQGRLFASLDQARQSARLQLQDAVRMDADAVMKAYRQAHWQGTVAQAQGQSPNIAIVLNRLSILKNLKYAKADRAGRLWQTAVYTRTVARGLLVTAYVETYVLSKLAAGFTTGYADNGDGTSTEFSLVGTHTDLPSYDDMVQSHFHPNAARFFINPKR